ncbi:hypothetical protein [Flavobacterium defluvii]|uniref:Uncharacterized protein n=1 Tax=Flavobacterium defluvii TaxID=370979 RepID=A0A1M5L030_9FLAO|nr:hypothetical protein [Flavobacterium defluvii]SHG58315.1 hypothetical protein SAMN05443663_103230 [Flavobacterium defluvii]
MFKKLLLAFLFLNSFISFSQDLVNYTPIELKRNRDVFQIINNDNKEVTLFVSDKVKVKALLLNEKMQIIDSMSTERPNKKKYDEMIGYNSTNSNARLFWSSSDRTFILSQFYDFKTQKITTQELTLVVKNEKVLQDFSSKNKFYILTVVKDSNTLKLHVFDQDGDHETKTIDLSNFRFYKKDYTKTNLYGIFEENLLPFEAPFSLQSIHPENLTSIADGAKKRKCYFSDNQITITLDANPSYTQALMIDLENFTVSEKIIKKPVILTQMDNMSVNSNSFYFDNKFYQIKSSADELFFTISDLEGNSIKEFHITGETPIDFKNSVIYQEGGDFGGKRILEKSSQFIRKVNNLNSGISCYHIGENTLITLGSVSEIKQIGSPVFMGAGVAGIAASAIAGGLAGYYNYNATMNSFNSYANRKVVKIECLFDKDNNHVQGELQSLAFDKIRTFFDDNTDVSSKTLFKFESAYYLGYYDNKTKEYIIRKFVD